MDELQEYELTGTLSPKEQPEPPKRSFLDRIFGESMGNTRKAIYKMLLVVVLFFSISIGADVVGEHLFGEDSLGNEASIWVGVIVSVVLARLAWVVKY